MVAGAPHHNEGGDAVRWSMSEELLDYRAAVRSWVADVSPMDEVRRWADAHDPSPFERRLLSDGWAGVGVPEELGGQGGGLAELAVTAEELARACAPSGWWSATVLAVPALAGRPTVIEEAWAGGGVALAVPAELPPDEGPWLELVGTTVTGALPRVLGADRVSHLVVPVLDAGAPRLALVRTDGDTVTCRPRHLLDRTRSTADVQLTGAPADVLDIDAERVLDDAALRAAVLVSADALGVSTTMLDLSVQYSKQRHQFGKPIGSFQAVKHAAATMLVGVEAARSVLPVAAAVVDAAAPDAGRVAAAVKSQVTAEAVRVAESALTVHGAIGYTWEHDLHLYGKRARLDEQLFGTPHRWNERLADLLALT